MENKPEPTLENLMDAVNELLQSILNHQGPLNITPDLEEDIEKLRKTVSQFKEDSHQFFDALNIDIKEYEQEVLNDESIRTSDKQLIKRSKDIQLEARVMRSIVMREYKNRKNHSSSGRGERRLVRERKKLFKTIGGDDKWIPL